MINDQSFIDKSYELHENHFQAYKAGGERSSRAKTWMNFDTVDFWRHQRMYDSVLPILKVDSKSKWLTVGDGRYGRDAHILKRMGPNISDLATDISDSLLA